jgi:hypothetical protein
VRNDMTGKPLQKRARFLEAYLIGEKSDEQSFDIEAYELEASIPPSWARSKWATNSFSVGKSASCSGSTTRAQIGP